MGESTMNARGQLTVPAVVRKLLKARPGTKFIWGVRQDGTVILYPKTGSILDLAGAVTLPEGLTVAIEDLGF